MILFLYLSGIFAILTGIILFNIQEKKLSKRHLSSKQWLNIHIKMMVFNLSIMCITVIFLLFIVPFIIWNVSSKETGIVNKIIETKEISPVPSSGGKYIKEIYTNNSKNYTINTGTIKEPYLQNYNYRSVEIIRSNTEKPRYQKIYKYTMRKLKDKGILFDSVNDIYANVYLQYDNGKYVGNKIQIIIP